MTKSSEQPLPALRIATVWQHESMQPTRCLHGLYRQADQTPGVTLRKFDALAADFTGEVLRPLKQWKPHGVVLYMVDWERLKILRQQLSGVPFVATALAPPEWVDSSVVASIAELIAMARDYFQASGLRQMALFSLASEFALKNLTDKFRAAVPNGLVMTCPCELFDPPTPAQKQLQKKIMTDQLRTLPKPVGVVTLETESAAFLLQWCQKLGLRVPQDVQIIGVDEEDDCLACEPHLTSLETPNVRIGELALTTMLRLLRREPPPPPAIVRVPGGALVVRGSTGRAEVGKMSVPAALARMPSYAAKGLTATRAAKQSGVCRATFYKEFAATTGSTPARHLRRLRLEESCRRLREDSTTVTSIAAACGFKDLISFVHFFRRETGETPSAYRKRMAGK